MNLFNVRKGQFVYFNNALHKVYAVKTFFRQSVHLIRLSDFKQQLTTARAIDLYKPQHLDSFTFNHKLYTLDKNKRAEIGDYILVIHPSPDYLDHHYLHAIEMVAAIESNGIISSKSNGIKHHEYWVMVPELLADATIIDLQHPNEHSVDAQDPAPPTNTWPETSTPRIGDVYQKTNSDPDIQTMVIAIKGQTIYLGGDLKVSQDDLTDRKQWTFIDQL